MNGDTRQLSNDSSDRTFRRSFGAVLVALLFMVTFAHSGPIGADDDGPTNPEIEELRTEQDRVRSLKAEQASSINVIEAEQSEILDALDAISENVHASEAHLESAEQALVAAEWESTAAALRASEARADIERLEARIRDDAIASYIRSPTAELEVALESEDPNDAAARQVLIDTEFGRRVDNLDRLRARREDVEIAEREAEQARRRAEQLRSSSVELLAAARTAQEQQLAFESQVDDRLEAALAEAASLSALDKEFADKIAAEQAEIVQRLAAERARAARAAEEARRAEAAKAQADQRSTTATSTDTPLTSSNGRRRKNTQAGVMEQVRGFWVHTSIADDVDAMIGAAAADGIRFGGGGYRDPADQIRLRRAHCGTSNYAIYEMRSSRCRPPTARPGRSMHEQGKALDLTYNGRIITSRNSPGFRWLRDNAARYGFKNLPSEPWHWSVNGR